MAQNGMPALDLDSILESELGTPDPAPAPNSEGADRSAGTTHSFSP